MQLNAERLPRVSSPKTAASLENTHDPKDRQRRYSWAWNIPLLLASVAVLAVGGCAVAGLYIWQSKRLSSEMLERATVAEQAKDYQDQVKWLSRYVRLAPENSEAIIQLGIATDNAVETNLDLQGARIRLSNAIAATGELPAFETQRTELRRRLIKRLLQLGGVWAAEAERQIIFFAAPPDDPEALSWLAKAIASQHLSKMRGEAKTSKFKKEEAYWNWMAEQPVGYVLREALRQNPDDLELALVFLNALFETPIWFDGGDAPPSDEQLQKEAEKLCQRLIAMQDSGRAQWLAYSYKLKQDAGMASALLGAALPGALDRLEENLQSPAESESQNAESESRLSDVKGIPLSDEDDYQPFWDWQLALAAATQATAQSQVAEAQSIYERLLPLASRAISRNQREATYLGAGRAYWAGNNTEKAIEVWTNGAQSLKGSIELSGTLLMTLTDLGRTEEAERALKDLDGHIKQQFSQVDGVQGAQLSLADKQNVRQRLEEARWNADVFRSQLRMQRGDFRGAVEGLAKAYRSPLSIAPDSRIRSGRLLAECYGKLQLWDLAGQTLDSCIVINPTDIALRRLAADAWRRLGASERATSQLEALDDGSFITALEVARLKATAEASEAPEQRDLESVRAAIQVARLRWEAMPENERARQPIWLLEILEIAFTARTDDADPEKSHARLEALAAKYATNPEVQLLAVSSLARQKKIEPAKQPLRRLQKLAEVSGKPEDRGNAIMAEALIAEAAEGVDAALRIIREGITAVPNDALRLAKMGASLARMHKKSTVAYELFKLIPEENWDVDTLMMAGQIGISSDSAHGPAISDADLQRWEERLRRLEGEDGCNWRYMAARRLIDHSGRSSDRAELLTKAEKHFTDIDRLRPRWGMGAALGGQIAALQQAHEKAISLLRRAIRDGDTQVSTILLLVSELTATARFDEAQQELKRLANLPESVVPTSMWEISLAQRKGDLNAALDLARKSTSRNRNDATSWLVASQTALAVSRSKDTAPEEKAKLRAEAWDALEHAASITGGKDINVWNARFQFHLEAGDKDKAKQELEALQSSPLPPSASLIAAANGLLLLQDFDAAQARVKEAMALAPNAAQPHVAMARILERMGDRQGLLSELQAAHRLDSEDADIRERLAVAYVLVSDEIPWSEVDRLLGANSESTSAKPMLSAMLSLERGDQQRVEAAVKTLNAIADSTDAQAMTAKRVLARHFAKQWRKADREERNTPEGRKNFLRARAFYDALLNTEPPAPADGVAFAHLLIEADQLDDAKLIADRFSAAVTSPLVLQLRLKIAQLQGEDVATVASSWLASANGIEQEERWEEVGKAMSEIGLHQEALSWLEKAYKADSTRFRSYAVGLAKAGQTDKAIDLCVSVIQQDENLDAATLLPQIALLDSAEQQSEAVEQALAGAIKKHADSAPLLETVATLRLMQERYAESVALYEQSEKLVPNRPQTLNNLAIALAELPARKNSALEKISKAIQLYGRHPQFLDTLAIVQSKLGEHGKAKATLEEALSVEKDPRFQMRLVEELIALGEQSQAQNAWKQIELERLKAMALTPAEQRSFTKLSKELGSQE